MRVSRIEIFGFKSFMERLVLPLDSGVTGIVGPNGCGKSNIVDALRWVLGETRASSLRGGVLEDVIFNGTDRLRPLGLAEVTITLRATEQDFFNDLNSGAAEAELVAAIEETSAEVDELAGGSQQLTQSVAIEQAGESSEPRLRILQGGLQSEVKDPSFDKPQENSSEVPLPAFESPKGASLATRFGWLKDVTEVQVTRRLYRSGESEYFLNRVACRLRDLKDFFRAVGLSARAYTVVAQGEVSRIVTAKPEERRHILEEAAGVVGFRDKILSANRRLEETSTNVSRLEDIIKEVTRSVSSLKRQAGIAKNRAELKSRLQFLESELAKIRISELNRRVQELRQELAGLTSGEDAQGNSAQAQLENTKAKEHALRSALLAHDVNADQLRSKVDALREELTQRARRRTSRVARISELSAFAAAQETEVRRLIERQNTVLARQQENAAELQGLALQEQKLTADMGGLERIGTEELHRAAQVVSEHREHSKRLQRTVQEVRESLVSARSKAEVLQQQLVAASPIVQLQKSLKGAHNNGGDGELAAIMAASRGILVDSLIVPAQFTKAVQAVLGEKAAFLVSSDPHQLGAELVERASKSSRQDGAGLAFGVLGVTEGRSEIANSFPEDLPPGILGKMSDLVQFEPTVAGIAIELFGSVFIAENLSSARALLEQARSSSAAVTVVTLAGEVLNSYSFFSFKHEGGVVQIKQSLDELKLRIAALESQAQEMTAERDRVAELLVAAEQHHAQLAKQIQEQQSRIREVGNQLGNVRGRVHAADRLRQQLEGDVTRAGEQIAEAKQRIIRFNEEQNKIKTELAQLDGEDDSSIQAEIDTVQAELRVIDQARKAGREELSSVTVQLESLRDLIEQNRARISRLELELQKVSLERQNVESRLAENYGSEFVAELMAIQADSLENPSALDTVEASKEVEAIRARIHREGEVDPTSIERYEAENLRLTELQAQRGDLAQAASTLKETIKRLTETSETRFVQTFDAVRERFEGMIPRLFGGGKGTISLDDPEHPLESGVDIAVRPPGKNLKSIDLLSGGEKALCATALIMAMFLVRPGPLCVLDEVDAPLDEANLERFLSLIKEMSTRVQFLMITHNKSSMSVSDRLVGVTMQEPGASKVVGVSLEEAYSHVA